jgi:hypothetical protein
MKQPNYERFTGRLSLGLLSANAYVSGPIVKGKTAFSVGLRRSWIDAFSTPTLAIINKIKKNSGEKIIGTYNFMDFNARIDHRFNSSTSVYVMGYYGHDYLKLGKREFESSNKNFIVSGNDMIAVDPDPFFDESINRLSWGNWGVLAAFDKVLNKGRIDVTAYYSNYHSSYEQSREYQSDMQDKSTYGYLRNRTENGIYDIGANAKYSVDFGEFYRLNVGIGQVHHNYQPEWLTNESTQKEEYNLDDTGDLRISGNEAFAYIDNTLNAGKWVSVNFGVRGVMYHINHTDHNSLEPRASVRVKLTDNYSIKGSYSRMYQYVQQISSNYINLPTDLWQPTGAYFKPLRSDQYSVGFYGNLPMSMYFSAEGWYKDMKNLLEYHDGISVINSNVAWQDKLTLGKGWSYGIDLNITKEAGGFTGSIGYGLMWNWRKFAELNQGAKYPAKFDNRHKININANYRFNAKVELNVGWTYMTGNRLTLALYNYDEPGEMFPDAPTTGIGTSGLTWEQYSGLDYYSTRNNVRMPAFHRLDVSVSLHKKLKKGREGVWNFGLYNTYCRMNSMTIKKDDYIDSSTPSRTFKTLSIIPIIPSASYTYVF